MIVDVTGIILTPGKGGAECAGNGSCLDGCGQVIQCCCDECDYLLCCVEGTDCEHCQDAYCPRAKQ